MRVEHWQLYLYEGRSDVVRDQMNSDSRASRLKTLDFELRASPFGPTCWDMNFTSVKGADVEPISAALLDTVKLYLNGLHVYTGRVVSLPGFGAEEDTFKVQGQYRLAKTVLVDTPIKNYTGNFWAAVKAALEGKLGLGNVLVPNDESVTVEAWTIDDKFLKLDSFCRMVNDLMGGGISFGFRSDGVFVMGRRPLEPVRTIGLGDFEAREAALANRLYVKTGNADVPYFLFEDQVSVARDGPLEETEDMSGLVRNRGTAGKEAQITATAVLATGGTRRLAVKVNSIIGYLNEDLAQAQQGAGTAIASNSTLNPITALTAGFYPAQDGHPAGYTQMFLTIDTSGLTAADQVRLHFAASGEGSLSAYAYSFNSPSEANWRTPEQLASMELRGTANGSDLVLAGDTTSVVLVGDGTRRALFPSPTVPGIGVVGSALRYVLQNTPALSGSEQNVSFSYNSAPYSFFGLAGTRYTRTLTMYHEHGDGSLTQIAQTTSQVSASDQDGTVIFPSISLFAHVLGFNTGTDTILLTITGSSSQPGTPDAQTGLTAIVVDFSTLQSSAESLFAEKYGPTLRASARLPDEFQAPGGRGRYRFGDGEEKMLIDYSGKYTLQDGRFETRLTGGSKTRYNAAQLSRVALDKLTSRISALGG